MDVALFFLALAALFVVLVFAIRHIGDLSKTPLVHPLWRRFAAICVVVTSLLLIDTSGCSATRYYGWREGLKTPKEYLYLSIRELWIPFTALLIVSVIWTFLPMRHRFGTVWRRVYLSMASPLMVLGSFVLFFYGCGQGLTTKMPLLWSPDQANFMRVEEFDAGAVDSFHTQVIIRPRTRLRSSTVFATAAAGPSAIKAIWLDSAHVLVSYPKPNASYLDRDFMCRDAGSIHVVCHSE